MSLILKCILTFQRESTKTDTPTKTITPENDVDSSPKEKLPQPIPADSTLQDLTATEPPSTSETPSNPTENPPATEVKQTEDTKGEVWEGAESTECPLPTVTNVTLTNLTEFAPQDPTATPVNLENYVYGLAPAAVMTSLSNQQIRPIANQFGANTTTLFAAGNYPHIITTPSQVGLQGFASAGVWLHAILITLRHSVKVLMILGIQAMERQLVLISYPLKALCFYCRC